MLITRLFLIIIGLNLSSGIAAASFLNLREFFDLSEKNDPEFKKIFAEEEKSKYIHDQGLPSPKTTVGLEHNYGLISGSPAHSSALTGAITRDIVETGTSLSLTHSKTSRLTRKGNVTSLQIEQSLYKNIFGRDVRLQEDSLDLQTEIIKLNVLENYENYLLSILTIYLDFKKTDLDFQLAEKNYTEAQVLKENVRRKFKSNIATKTDLNRSELLVLNRKEDVINKRNLLMSKKYEIQKIIGLDHELSGANPIDEISSSFEIKKIDQQQQKVENLRPILIANLNQQIASKKHIQLERANDPTFNFVAGFNHDKSTGSNTVIIRNETTVGFKLEIPLGDSKSKADAQLANVELYKTQLSFRSMVLESTRKIEDYKNKIKEFFNKIQLNKQQVQLTKSILVDEEKRYAYGKIDLEKLIETKNNYAEYRFQYQANLVEYAKNYLEWLSLNDQLIEFKNKI